MKTLLATLTAITAVAMLAFAPPVLAQPPLPLAFWSFDDGANPTADDTGNGNDGTLYGTPTYDSFDQPLEIGGGNSLSFNGTTNYIALNMSLTGSGSLPQLTASVWFKTTFNTGSFTNNWSFLDFDRSEFFNVYVTPSGRIGFSTTGEGPFTGGFGDLDDMFSNTSGLNDGFWHHVAVVYDGSDKLIYVDGVLDNTVLNAHSGALGRDTTRYGFIGDGSEATSFNGTRNNILYDGKMDEVAFWNVALTAEQIENIASGAPILVLTVDVDIKPGSDPNSINLCSGGAVPVAILGSDTFFVSDVKTDDTLRFAEAAVKVVGRKDPHTLCSYQDVNDDWIDDLVCHFVTTDIAALDGESSTATVHGELLDGTPIEGTDSVNIVKDTCN
jgi:hypothetical protein